MRISDWSSDVCSSDLQQGNSNRMSTAYQDRYWNSADGLRLHFRDYPGRDDRPPVLCLHGLTRNARDFAGLARSEARSVGKECVGTCRYRWSTYHIKKTH